MHHFSNFLIALFIIGCSSTVQHNSKQDAPTLSHVQTESIPNLIGSPSNLNDEPYELLLSLDSISNKEYMLTLKMNLKEGAFYVSPNSPGTYLGIFKIIMDSNDYVQFSDEMSEFPKSVESTDPWSRQPVNIVTESTIHTQKVTIKNPIDFELKGYVTFTIEPRCTKEENWFTLNFQDGKLNINAEF
ncbi:MAG: hypothetical protein ACPGD5_06950 [Salibacteraceae bacterium]